MDALGQPQVSWVDDNGGRFLMVTCPCGVALAMPPIATDLTTCSCGQWAYAVRMGASSLSLDWVNTSRWFPFPVPVSLDLWAADAVAEAERIIAEWSEDA